MTAAALLAWDELLHCSGKHVAALEAAKATEVIDALRQLTAGTITLPQFASRVSTLPLELRPHVSEVIQCAAGLHGERKLPQLKEIEPPATAPSIPAAATPSAAPENGAKPEKMDGVAGEEEEDDEDEADDMSVMTAIADGEELSGEGKSGGNGRRLRNEWTETEEAAFLLGLKTHGREWGAVQKMVKTRNRAQLRTHYRYLAETFSRNRERAQLGKEPARRVGHRGRPRSEASKRVLGEGSTQGEMTEVMRELGAVILDLESQSPMLGSGLKRRPTRVRANPLPGEGLMLDQFNEDLTPQAAANPASARPRLQLHELPDALRARGVMAPPPPKVVAIAPQPAAQPKSLSLTSPNSYVVTSPNIARAAPSPLPAADASPASAIMISGSSDSTPIRITPTLVGGNVLQQYVGGLITGLQH